MTKAFFAAGHALAAVISASACLSFAAVAADAPRIDLPRRPKDGYGDVSRANAFGAEGKWDAGRKFIAELRARPAEGRTLEERQSVDMAEFALLRHSFETNRTRCVECLKTVYDAGCTSFWGWAAYSFLKEHGEDVPEPPKDPLRGLGAWGDGVVNLEPKKLVTGNVSPERSEPRKRSLEGWELGTGNGEWVTGKVPSIACPGNIKPADLKPGSSVRRAILRKRLVEICTEEKINEVLGAEGGAALFARLWEDDATLEDFLLSGPVFDAPLALETLMTLFLNDETEKWSRTELGRRAAVAVALNARNGDDMKATVRHWAAFRRIGMWGRFVPEAAKRDCREWRFVVRYPVDSADILYLNAAKEFPKRKIGNLGLRDIPYRKLNCFGVRKWAKGGVYYTPWLVSGIPRYYLFTRVGGICEEQSSWAALFANAHGIMAVPAFQPARRPTRFRPRGPAHLCWLLRQENGEWRIYNNIRPYTGSRFTLWGKGFQYVQSAERAFADRTALDESEMLMFDGRFKEAAMRCPYNWTAWRAYTDSLKASNASSRDWMEYLKDLVKHAPEGRQATWDFAHEAMDVMAANGMKKTPLAKEASRLFAGLPQPKSRIAEEMDFAKFALERELARFRGFPKLHDEVLAAALAANKDSANYLPQIFAYAIKRFGKDKARLARFFKAAADAIGVSPGEETHGENGKIDWRRLCSVRGCLMDRTAFRMMADFRNEDDPPKGEAKVSETDYGAPLASGDALVGTSSSGKGDTPEDYARVSDATPYDPNRKGLFTTKAEAAPYVVVELAGDVEIAGVTVVGDSEKLSFWVSDDGEEWRKVGERGMGNGERKLDLRKDSPSAKFVKVALEPGGGKKKPLSLSKILVYGNKLF